MLGWERSVSEKSPLDQQCWPKPSLSVALPLTLQTLQWLKVKTYLQPGNKISSLQVHFLAEVSTSSVQLVMARERETSTTVTSQKPAGLPTVADQTRLISDGCHLIAGCQYGPDPGFVGAQWLGWKHLDQRNLRARSVASLTWPELT